MMRRLAAIALVVLAIAIAFGPRPAAAGAASRAHVYVFRGLADVFSTGMDVLTDELNRRGVYATSHSHTDWKPLADQAAANYKAGKEGPIILIGHSLGADAVMEMADYLGDKGVPVALVMPFDGTQSFPASGNVGRVVNFTQRDYAYMRKGSGFRGTLVNVDVSSDPDIGHLNIDKSPRLHARAIAEVLAVASGHMGMPVAEKPPATPPSAASAARRETIGRGEEQPIRSEPAGIPMGAPAGAPIGAPTGTPMGAEAARGAPSAVPPNVAPGRPATRLSPPATIAPAPAAPVSSGLANSGNAGSGSNPGYANPGYANRGYPSPGYASPGYASPGFPSPVFPPQPPPPRLGPARPLDIPD
jgi:Thioesterase domain